MKIHSSSLPSNPNQKIGRNNSAAQNKDNNELLTAKKTEPKKVNQPSTPEAIKKTLATIKSDVNSSSQNNINKPTSSLAQKALSAYNQQFNAPQHEQRANLISGIDTYA
jgi:hypothetical protein